MILLKEKDGSITAEIYNYFVSPFSIAPVTIAWGILPDTNQYAFTITIRFKVKENMPFILLARVSFRTYCEIWLFPHHRK